MAWIELHQTLWTHRKTFILANELGVNEVTAAGHMARLWCWALDNAPSGSLVGLPNRVIAFGAGWNEDADKFVYSCLVSQFMDETDDGIVLHDWFDYAGRLIDKRKANAERMRNKRATNVQRTFSERAGATVPYSTVPNQTNKDDDDQSARPTKNVYERIEGIMQVRLVKQNYRLVGDEYHSAQALVNEGFTEDEIFQGITYAFETQQPRSFKYCAEVIRTMRETMDGYKEAAAGGETNGRHTVYSRTITTERKPPANKYRADKPGAF